LSDATFDQEDRFRGELEMNSAKGSRIAKKSKRAGFALTLPSAGSTPKQFRTVMRVGDLAIRNAQAVLSFCAKRRNR